MTQEDAPRRLPTEFVASFAEIEAEFMRRVAKTVWCTMATVDSRGRPRTRLIHPIWEGSTGYIGTGRHSLKEKHLAKNPNVSFTYWDPDHEQVYIDATAEWLDDPADRRRIWELYRSTPPPLGYDPGMIWREGPESEDFGVLKLTPRRIELFSLSQLVQGKPPLVWKP
jgi:general stress protein 26